MGGLKKTDCQSQCILWCNCGGCGCSMRLDKPTVYLGKMGYAEDVIESERLSSQEYLSHILP